MGETKKVQLAVRVPADVRDLCLELARKVGLSKNVFVEKLIRAAADAPNLKSQWLEQPALGPQMAELAGVPVVSDPMIDVGTVEIRDGDQTVGKIVNLAKPFAANCKAGTLHWKHGPGNPCRFCEGEI